MRAEACGGGVAVVWVGAVSMQKLCNVNDAMPMHFLLPRATTAEQKAAAATATITKITAAAATTIYALGRA